MPVLYLLRSFSCMKMNVTSTILHMPFILALCLLFNKDKSLFQHFVLYSPFIIHISFISTMTRSFSATNNNSVIQTSLHFLLLIVPILIRRGIHCESQRQCSHVHFWSTPLRQVIWSTAWSPDVAYVASIAIQNSENQQIYLFEHYVWPDSSC